MLNNLERPLPANLTLNPTSGTVTTLVNICHLIEEQGNDFNSYQSAFSAVYTDAALTAAYDGGVSAASAGDKLYFTFASHKGVSNDMSKFQVGQTLESWISGTLANLRQMKVIDKTDDYLKVEMLEDDAASGDTVDDASCLTIVSHKWSGYIAEASVVGHTGVTAAVIRAQSDDMPSTMFGPNLLGSVSAPTATLATSCSPARPAAVSISRLYATWTTTNAAVRIVLVCDPFYKGGIA